LSVREASSSSSRSGRIQEFRDFRVAKEQGSRTPRAGSGAYHTDVGVAGSGLEDDDDDEQEEEGGGIQDPGESFAPIFDEPMDEGDDANEADEPDELEEEV
jgi:hypothetical protein